MPYWPPILALIWGMSSQDPVQVGYREIQTLTSLGLHGLQGLQVATLFLGCSRYANNEDLMGRTLVSSYKRIQNYSIYTHIQLIEHELGFRKKSQNHETIRIN
jgi:hypothetical protein